MKQDLGKYRDLFLSEAKEHLAAMNAGLLELEKHPDKQECITDILRAAHTLKSMAATMDCHEMEALCHAIEDVLEAVKAKTLEPSQCADALFECFDALAQSRTALSQGQKEQDTGALVQKLEALAAEHTAEVNPSYAAPSEEAVEKLQTIEVNVERLDSLMNLAEQLLVNRLSLERIGEKVQDPELSVALDALGRLVTELQYNVMQSRMVPISFIFDRFPRMVRDLAKQQDKKVDLQMEGRDIELDRAVIDEIGESLVHLLRNAVGHGIEPPEEREKAGKPGQGTITLTARRTKSTAVIEVADDGAGLDIDRLRNAAAKRGLLAPNATNQAVLDSIFSSVSTSREVTAVSGRGLGLGIVRNKIESLGGVVSVKSTPGHGTTFIIELPLTLAIINALFVEVGGEMFAIPLANVERLVTVNKEAFKGILDYEAIVLDEEDIPVTRLDSLFDTQPATLEKQPIAIVRRGEELLGLVVDAFHRTQEIVVKPLNKLVRESKYFSGCTIVGSGEVVLILDVANLILSKRAVKV